MIPAPEMSKTIWPVSAWKRRRNASGTRAASSPPHQAKNADMPRRIGVRNRVISLSTRGPDAYLAVSRAVFKPNRMISVGKHEGHRNSSWSCNMAVIEPKWYTLT